MVAAIPIVRLRGARSREDERYCQSCVEPLHDAETLRAVQG
jgi:hypothetical protein